MEGGELSGEGFGLGFHRPIKPAALRCCGLKRVSNHLRANRALRHLLLQLTNAFAGLTGDFLKRVEAGIDHLQQILTRQLPRRRHLRKRKRQRLELLSVTLGNVTKLVKALGRLISTNAKGHQCLGVFREVFHPKRSSSRLTLQVVDEGLCFSLITQHGREARGVLLHLGVVLHPVPHRASKPFSHPGHRVNDALHARDDRLRSKIGF